jgi:ABC-type transport system involved in cytochrome bd biosynthesis fused ATPase/permease subunit
LLLAGLASFGALAANIALMTAAPYLISRATLVTGFAALAVAVTAVRGFAIARAALRYSERYVAHLAALRVLTEIRVWLYRAIEPLAPGGLRGFRSGDLLARTVADVDTLDAFFVRGLVPPAAAVLAVAFACAILAVFEPAMAIVLFAFLAIGGVAVPLVARRLARHPSMRSIAARAELHAALASDLSGLADLTAFRAGGEAGRGPGRVVARHGSRAADPLLDPRGRRGAGSILAGVAGLAVLALAIPGSAAGGSRGLPRLAAARGVRGLRGRPAARRRVPRGGAQPRGRRRTFEIVDAPLPVPEPDEPLAPRAHPGLELRHVRFRYDDGLPTCWTT